MVRNQAKGKAQVNEEVGESQTRGPRSMDRLTLGGNDKKTAHLDLRKKLIADCQSRMQTFRVGSRTKSALR